MTMDGALYLWVEVFTPDWQKHPDVEGPIPLIDASVTRLLNGAGSVQFNVPATEERVIRVLQNETRIRIYGKQNGEVREIGAGILSKKSRRISSSGESRSFDGPDTLQELKHYDVLLGRVYRNVRFADVVADLTTGIMENWQVEVEPAYADDLIEARMDGGSVLNTLQELVKKRGLRLRRKINPSSTLDNVVEIGKFGQDLVLDCLTPPLMITPQSHNNVEIAFIDTLSVVSNSEDIVNWVLPLGNGTGVGALDLRYSTREGIYTMIGPAGQTLYYMMDEASVAMYGMRQKTVTFEDIQIVSNSGPGKQSASNMLADNSRAYLNDNSMPQTIYGVTIKKCNKTVQPGDLINISYRGRVLDKRGVEIESEGVEGQFYVLKVTERVGADGGFAVSLEISNIPKMPEDSAAYIVNAVEKLKAQFRRPMVAAYWSENTWQDFIQGCDPVLYASNPGYYREAQFKLEIDDSVTELTRIRIRFKTKRLITTFVYYPPPTPANPGDTIGYGQARVVENRNFPAGISLWVNGVNVSTQYGGPWNVQAGNVPIAFNTTDGVDVICDITDLIINASGGMYQDHSIIFKASPRNGYHTYPNVYFSDQTTQGIASNGLVEMNIRVQGICQAILPI